MAGTQFHRGVGFWIVDLTSFSGENMALAATNLKHGKHTSTESNLQPVWDGLREADGKVRELIETKPFAVLAVALTAGYFLGRLISRR
jgi:ElaB/YqjD/DUF883 family membrane-anchored ribosome-binding protein